MSTLGRHAVIFDVDGVLVDSYNAHFRSWQALAAEYGREYTEDDFLAGFGRTSREVIADQWRGRLSPEQQADLARRKEALYRQLITDDFPAMDGAADLVQALSQAGIAVAVGSSGPPENVELVLDKLDIHSQVEATVTAGDVTRGKPDPQIFEAAAAKLKIPPEHCVVIEDAQFGVEAAKRAGMKCIGLLSTGHNIDELEQADLIVHSLRELSPQRIAEFLETPPRVG